MEKRYIYLFYGALILTLTLLYLMLKISLPIIVLVLAVFFLPLIVYQVKEYWEEEELENRFPIFLRDISYYIQIGQPLPVALKSVKNNDYGKKLNKEIRKLLAEMSIGIPFTEALSRMEKRVRSPKVKKAIISLVEVEKYGGKIEDAFIPIINTLQDLLEVKKERISKIRNFMFTYYLVFFGLIGIIVLTLLFFRTLLKVENKAILLAFKDVAMYLVMINAFFTGLVVGKAVSGKVTAGIIHSIVLLIASALIFTVLGYLLL